MSRNRDKDDSSLLELLVLILIVLIIFGAIIYFVFKLLWSKAVSLYSYLESIIKNKFNLGESTTSIFALALSSSIVFVIPSFIIILLIYPDVTASSYQNQDTPGLFIGIGILFGLIYVFFAFILSGINMIIRKHKESQASLIWDKMHADKGFGSGEPPMAFIVTDGDEFNYFYNSVIQPITNSPFFYKLLRLSALPIWMYWYLFGYFIRTISFMFAGSSKQKVTIITENIGNEQRLVRVPDKDYYFVDSNANSEGYYKERGQYYFNSDNDYEIFLNSYKFYRSNIFSISINNNLYEIFKRNDLGMYIIPNLPQGFDIKKYYLIKDKHGQWNIPINKENDNIIKNLISDLIKL